MKKHLQIANGFFLIFTVIFNYLSNTGIFNGNRVYHSSFHDLEKKCTDLRFGRSLGIDRNCSC